jgi:hypothetical protein
LAVFAVVLALVQERFARDHVVARADGRHGALFPLAGRPRRDLGLLGEPPFFLAAMGYLVLDGNELRRHLRNEPGQNRFGAFLAWFARLPKERSDLAHGFPRRAG